MQNNYFIGRNVRRGTVYYVCALYLQYMHRVHTNLCTLSITFIEVSLYCSWIITRSILIAAILGLNSGIRKILKENIEP